MSQDTSYRNTGIGVVGKVPWGSHFCQFYQTKRDLIDVLVPYFKAGIENNEFCMWITAEPLSVDEAKLALRKVLPNLDNYLQSGQIEIIPHSDWYLLAGEFNQERVLGGWVHKLDAARKKGFEGLRLTGNTFWLEEAQWKDFADYEAAVDRVIGNHRIIAFCTYSIDRCGAAEIADVVANHQFALMRRAGEWTVIQSADHKETSKALDKALAELEVRAHQLDSANEELACMNEELQTANEELQASNHELHVEIERRMHKEVELQGLNRTLKALTRSDQAMMRASDETTYLQEVCRIVIEDCGHAMVWIGFAEEDEGKTVRPMAQAGFEEGYLETLNITWANTERGQGPTGTAIRTGKSCSCRNMFTDPKFEPWRGEALKRGYASSIALPLKTVGKVLGAITIYSKEPDSFSEDEAGLLTELANDLAFGIETLRLREAQKQAYAERAWLASFPEKNPSPVVELDLDRNIHYFNNTARELFPDLLEKGIDHPWLDEWDSVVTALHGGIAGRMVRDIWVDGACYHQVVNLTDDTQYIRIYGVDVTEQRKGERERELRTGILHLINESTTMQSMIRSATKFFQEQTGCEAVGVRLAQGDDFPYFETRGFSEDFVLAENSLCEYSPNGDTICESDGTPIISCMCGNVICGRFDPSKPFFTENGSFWTNSTTQLLASTSESDRQSRTRNRCNGEGYESVALLPLQVSAERIGLLQLNDRRKGLFSVETIPLWERLAGILAVALAKFRAEEENRCTEARLESLFKISEHQTLSVQELLDFTLNEALTLTSSKVGYIYYYDESRREFTLNTWSSEVMKQCAVAEQQTIYELDKTGIWGEAVRQAKPIIINDFHKPNPLKKGYPEGHAPLHKFMTIPVFTEGRIVAVVGVANKETNYDASDVRQLTLLMDAVWKITERKRIENALHESEEKYRTLFRSMSEGFALHEIICGDSGKPIDYRFIEINEAFERLTGLKSEDIIGRTMLQALPGNDPYWVETYGNVALTGQPTRFENYSSPLDRWYEVYAYSPVKGRFAVVFTDITERKRIQAERDELSERDRHIARVLQDAILPADVPAEVGGYTLAVRYKPALREAEVGGDFYDIFDLGDGKFGVLIGDVAGKGLLAAIRVAAARHALRSYAYIEPSPARVMELANRALCMDTGDEISMLTAIFAVIDSRQGSVTYSSAGHEPPIICCSGGTCDTLASGGVPMGVISDARYSDVSRLVEPGDTVVMITDGIVEARAPGPELFGIERVIDTLNAVGGRHPDEIATALLDAATAHAKGRLQDDAAIVIIRA